MSSFDGASLQDLRAMIANGDPGGLDAVASKWSAVHDALRQAQADLLQHTLAATTHWQGAAADAFSARADELHRSLGNGAAFAFNASSGVSCAADALRAAQAAMPRESAPAAGFRAAQQATATGATPAEYDEHQRQRATAVMQHLEDEYAAAGEMIGTPGIGRISSDHGIFRTMPCSNRRLDSSAHNQNPKDASTPPICGHQREGKPVGEPGNMHSAPISSIDNEPGLNHQWTSTPRASLEANSAQINSPSDIGAGLTIHRGSAMDTAGSRSSPSFQMSQTDSWQPEASFEHGHQPNSTPVDTVVTGNNRTPWPKSDTTPSRHEITDARRVLNPIPRQSNSGNFGDVQTSRNSQSPKVPGWQEGVSGDEYNGIPHSSHPAISASTRDVNSMAPGIESLTRESGRSRRRSRRPSYLVADARHWASDVHPNPPVIDH